MQIVRDLAGYSYGRSDLVRRAMSKKKADVMAKERQNFVYGNKEENIPGCIAKGISAEVANKIYDEMTDFAKYAFNRSHAAGYSVITYQTAFLKYYYPKEYMAALLTSVMSNTRKVSEYIDECRKSGIEILPPDVNEGLGGFSVSGNAIRYGMGAIKGLGDSVIDSIVEERVRNGKYRSLQEFIERTNSSQVSKKAIESLIKAGAMDSMPGTRLEKMSIFERMADAVAKDKKSAGAGQMTLFDFVPEDAREAITIKIPELGEFENDDLLAKEKDVLGIYVSGHPLKEFASLMDKNVTAGSADFIMDEETGTTNVIDGAFYVVGGIITDISRKVTKKNTQMAFVTLEDMEGSIEVVVFPNSYDKYKHLLIEESKVFIRGRADTGGDADAKIIASEIIPFENVPRELWVQFADREDYDRNEEKLMTLASLNPGTATVIAFLKKERQIHRLDNDHKTAFTKEALDAFYKNFSESNVKLVEKSLAK